MNDVHKMLPSPRDFSFSAFFAIAPADASASPCSIIYGQIDFIGMEFLHTLIWRYCLMVVLLADVADKAWEIILEQGISYVRRIRPSCWYWTDKCLGEGEESALRPATTRLSDVPHATAIANRS